MKLNDLMKKISVNNLDFSVNASDKEGDGVIEQLDKIFLYALASGSLENGFRLPRLSDCDDLGVSRGSLFLFYNELPKRIDAYLGKSKDESPDLNNPASQLRDYTVDLKYSEECYNLMEKVFVEGIDLKKARTGKGEDAASGIYSEIQDVIAQCSAIRYPKQKIVDYFNSEMDKRFFDAENRALLAKITCAFQWNNESIRSLANVVRLRGRSDPEKAGDGKQESLLVADVYVPYSDILDENEWEVEQFSAENGLSYANLNFATEQTEENAPLAPHRYKKYDAIYCPDHSFAENLLSARAIYNFLLTAKNKLNEGGRLIINLFDPDENVVNSSKEKNQQKRFDLLLDETGRAVDRLTGEERFPPNEANAEIFRQARDLLPEKSRRGWDGKWIAFSKMSSFIHCDMECEDLKRSLGIDPRRKINEDGTEVKVWSFAEELKYTITVPDNAELPAIPKDCRFSGYVDYQTDRLSRSAIRRDMLEYVLIDPTNFMQILTDCGFEVDILDSDLKPYDVKNPTADRNIYYVCSVKK